MPSPLLSAALLLGGVAVEGESARLPDIALVVSDRPAAVEVQPPPSVLGRLVAEGAALRSAFAPSPVRAASLAALLTGRAPHRALGEDPGSELPSSLAAVLRSAGYETVFIGPWPLEGTPRAAGFGLHLAPRDDLDPAARAIELLGRQPRSRHVPLFVTIRWGVEDEVAGARTADRLGRFLGSLRSRSPHAVFVFTSLGGAETGGGALSDAALRVPLVFSAPARFPAEARSGLVGLADVAPTLAELLGIDLPYETDGASLLPILEGEAARVSGRSHLVFEFDGPGERTVAARGVRDERWSYVRYRDSREELHSVEPHRGGDLAGVAAHQRTRKRLAEALNKWMAQTDDPFPRMPPPEAWSATQRAQGRDPERPNVVMIVSDDQGWTDFGFMGHPTIRTPHLDRLAAEGALFPNGYVPTSLCRASLATLLTGMHGSQHKICCNDPPEGIARDRMFPFIRSAPTVPRLLGRAGYASLQTGKFWEGHYSNGGFTHGMTTGGREGGSGLGIGRWSMQPIYDFLESHRDQPSFVWYAPMMPHEPHDPPQRILRRYLAPGRDPALARYWAMCEWFDETVGQLLNHLDERGLRESTLVVFVVDNGWVQEVGEGPEASPHRQAGHGKLSPYDGGLRTPVILRWPGHIPPGRYDDLVSTVDVAPTILAACGLPPTGGMAGIDLMPRVTSGRPIARDAVFGEIYRHTAVDLDETGLNLTHLWVRQGDWKLIIPVIPPSEWELYDLADDPFESVDLARVEDERAQRLASLLESRWSALQGAGD